MFVHEITYTDFDGNERTEEVRFHLSPAELTELEATTPGGLKKQMDNIMKKKDGPAIMRYFKKIVRMSYGKKSEDGRRFMKSEEIWNDFAETQAYVELFMKLVTDEKFAQEFANAVIPDMKKYVPADADLSVVK
jgi:hypothetical protein|nr:MAG TPA: hypothetical protein [Caudoviricetes sp.]